MALFSNWFKSKPDGSAPNGAETLADQPEAPATAPGAPAPRAVASVRTVRPNPVQPVRLSGPVSRSPISLTSPTGPQAGGHSAYASPASRKVAFGSSEGGETEKVAAPVVPPSVDQPPALPVNPDGVVHLELGDFIDRIPANFLGSASYDRHQGIDFLVSELYSDLSRGRATVPASIIYRKCPEIFARPVSETEDVEVHLPMHRVVEQMGATFAPRVDQTAEESVAEIETPFLQVAMEDNARLPKAPGTSVGATARAVGLPTSRRPSLPSIPPPTVQAAPNPQISRKTKQISPISPLKQPVETRAVAAPTSQSAGPINPSKRPPSTVRASVAGGKIRLSEAGVEKAPATPTIPRAKEAAEPPKSFAPAPPRVASVSPSHQVTKKTARIQIPPISLRPAPPGSPRPPAGPADRTPPPSPARGPEPLTSFKPAGPAGSPSAQAPTFRSTPPPPSYVKQPPPSFSPTRSAPSAPVPETSLIVQPPPARKEPTVEKSQMIEMSLAAVLRGLPSTALVVEPSSVPDSARISLPFGLIEPQLSNGRVSIPLQVFRNALPSAFSHVLATDCDLTEAAIPLQEVFQNLPSNAISQRDDQIIEEARNSFPTPFSQKAEEDARRFGTPPPTAQPPAAAPLPEASLMAQPEAPVEASPTPVEEPPAAVEEPAEPFADKAEVSESVSDPEMDAPAAIPDPESPAEHAPEASPDEPVQPEAPFKEAGDPIADAVPAEEPFPVAERTPVAAAPATEAIPTAVQGADSRLQSLFMTEDDLDAKTIVRLASQLPGMNACSVMFDDGLLLASSQPQDGQTEGFSAMAPALFQKVLNFTTELSLGELQGCTLYTEQGLLSLFTHGNICLSVRHSGRGFLPGVREKLLVITRELAGMYAPADNAETPARD